MKFALCQISNKLINPPQGTLSERFYDTFWHKHEKDGYYKPEHFWEIPQWIAEVSYVIPARYERELMIVEEVDINLVPDKIYCFSVLDVNCEIIKYIIENNQQCLFVLGGYCKPLDADGYGLAGACWFDSIPAFCEAFGFPYKYGTDYSLFQGTKCIPRLTLSTGCKHHCKFCIVSDEVREKTISEVTKQVESFRDLNFELVYVNDKTYGQANNWRFLRLMYDHITHYNWRFKGFIVQTTADMVNKLPIEIWKQQHIEVVEIGVESYNDTILKTYRKPANETTIAMAVDKLKTAGVKVIFNILLGLPGETYSTYWHTYRFCAFAWPYGLNIYTLAAYKDSDLGIEVQDGDCDELNDNRSFWTSEERTQYNLWANKFYELGIEL